MAVCSDHGKTQPAPYRRSDEDVSWTPPMKVMLATVAQHPAARSHHGQGDLQRRYAHRRTLHA
jgi:hypothetical protein